jgi:hypothetical protein
MHKNTNHYDSIPERTLRGWPGHRTRYDRIGLDPLDSYAEEAHMEGVFYRNLFTLKLRIRNPFYLVLMFLLGVIPFTLFSVLILGFIFNEGLPNLILVIFPLLPTLIVGMVTINFILCILDIVGITSSTKYESNMGNKRILH